MGRKAKDPEVRRREIIEAAEALFSEKGFDQTSVTDITDRVGLSHGAFFYYFKSKNDLFKDVIAYAIQKNMSQVEQLLAEVGPSPVRRLQFLIDMSIRGADTDNKLVEYLHSEGNAPIHAEYVRQSEAVIVPLVTKIIEDGVREGVFDVEYPREWVELIIPVFDSIQHKRTTLSNEEYYRKMRALDSLVARALGIPEGTLSIKPKH